ncbi:hypothetical protein [Burkholderia cenocepacia]|uniref:hypothetical protein n=1 Tax=Burkholderia cenocepacia TaxID=95486 RepID=UPI0024B70193|nr:hypothetical protein [Burkholderia cenocepacia]MDI9686566.1 hypothetical protein [Burkholderia cenocepacia]
MDKNEFFSRIKADVKEIEVKAVGALIKFQVLTGKARDEFHAIVSAGDKSASFFEAAIVAATVLKDSGEKMFSPEDVEALRSSRADAVTELAQAAMAVNKIGTEAEAEAAKN